MIRHVACAFAFFIMIATARAQIEHELETIYATTAPKLALIHEGEIARRIEPILRKQSKYLVAQLRPWKQDPRALLLGNGGSLEGDIRSNAHTAFGLAVLARVFDDRAARDQSVAILRFLLCTHGAGEMKCADGKQWHNQWQSAMWAYSAGKAAWLLWDDLDPQLKWLAARMICDEADRFIDKKPPMQIERDTKAEENAWDSTVIALAYNMFPRHPHHETWRETAIRWQINSFVTSKDAQSDEMIDGKPLKQWLIGANIFDDYTLENHDRVHPDYMGTIRLNLHQKLIYDWAGNEPPASIFFNAERIYANLKKLALPDGNFVYPNGQDWQIHRNGDWFDLHLIMALRHNDAQAARLMRISLDAAEKMIARTPDGGIDLPDEVLVATTHPVLLELYADAYLHLRAMGDGPEPVEEARLWKDLSGAHVFEAGKFAVVRNERCISTFSWGRQVMGMAMPLRKDMLLTPNDRSLLGQVWLDAKKRDTPKVLRVESANVAGGIGISAVLSRADGAIEQRVAFVALGDGRTVYCDSLRLTGDKNPHSINLGTLGVLNDTNWVYHDARRTLSFEGGQQIFSAADADKAEAFTVSSPWYNLDGLGIVCLKTTGRQVYNARRSPVKARLEQVFHLNVLPPDATSAQTILVLYPSQETAQTRHDAGRCKLVQPAADRAVITLDDGKTIAIDLEHLAVGVK